jgi:hypothetical protein
MSNVSNVKVLAGNQLQLSGTSVQLTASGPASVTVSSSQIILTGTVSASGDVFVAGRLTALEYYTQIITGSVIYRSGSTKFGDDAGDTHQFTGSVFVVGALSASSFTGSGAGLTGVVTSVNLGPTSNLSASATSGAITIALSQSLDITNVTASNTVSASVGKFTTLSASNAEFSGNILIYGTASLANADAAYVRYVSNIDKVRVFPGLDVSGSSTISGNLDVTGSVSASLFSGSGAGLTNLPAANLSGTVAISKGGTGQTATPTNGQLLIGSGSSFVLNTLTPGSGVTIDNNSGSITINATGSGGTVTNVSGASNIVVVSGTTTPIVSLTSSVTGLTNVSSSNLTASIGLFAGGTFVVQARTVTSAHTIDSVTQDHVVFADASGGAFTVTLVDATTKGRQLVIKKADASVQTVTVSGSGVSGKIDTADNFQLNGPFQSITLVADGTSKWFIV